MKEASHKFKSNITEPSPASVFGKAALISSLISSNELNLTAPKYFTAYWDPIEMK